MRNEEHFFSLSVTVFRPFFHIAGCSAGSGNMKQLHNLSKGNISASRDADIIPLTVYYVMEVHRIRQRIYRKARGFEGSGFPFHGSLGDFGLYLYGFRFDGCFSKRFGCRVSCRGVRVGCLVFRGGRSRGLPCRFRCLFRRGGYDLFREVLREVNDVEGFLRRDGVFLGDLNLDGSADLDLLPVHVYADVKQAGHTDSVRIQGHGRLVAVGSVPGIVLGDFGGDQLGVVRDARLLAVVYVDCVVVSVGSDDLQDLFRLADHAVYGEAVGAEGYRVDGRVVMNRRIHGIGGRLDDAGSFGAFAFKVDRLYLHVLRYRDRFLEGDLHINVGRGLDLNVLPVLFPKEGNVKEPGELVDLAPVPVQGRVRHFRVFPVLGGAGEDFLHPHPHVLRELRILSDDGCHGVIRAFVDEGPLKILRGEALQVQAGSFNGNRIRFVHDGSLRKARS